MNVIQGAANNFELNTVYVNTVTSLSTPLLYVSSVTRHLTNILYVANEWKSYKKYIIIDYIMQ